MKFISHRGNLNGLSESNAARENSPDYIDEAINQGFEVETDIRLTTGYVPPGDFYLGHDYPQYQVNLDWLIERKDVLWLHAKNLEALKWLLGSRIGWNVFWHQEDSYTITSKGYIWTYPGSRLCYGAIAVMPENVDYPKRLIKKCGGICSDNILHYRGEYCENT